MIGLFRILPLIVLIIPFFDAWDFRTVQEATMLEHPTYDLSIYQPFCGFADVTSVIFLVATLGLGIAIYTVPIVCAIITRKALLMIRAHKSMSEKTKSNAMTLIYGLMCQTMVPFLSYTPIYSSYLYTQITGDEILITEHLTLVLASLPGLIDPLISFYFVVPYRNTISAMFRRERSSTVFVRNMSTM